MFLLLYNIVSLFLSSSDVALCSVLIWDRQICIFTFSFLRSNFLGTKRLKLLKNKNKLRTFSFKNLLTKEWLEHHQNHLFWCNWMFCWGIQLYPAKIYLFNVNNRNTRKRCEICSELIKETREWCHWHHSGVFIVDFEQIIIFFYCFYCWFWTSKF